MIADGLRKTAERHKRARDGGAGAKHKLIARVSKGGRWEPPRRSVLHCEGAPGTGCGAAGARATHAFEARCALRGSLFACTTAWVHEAADDRRLDKP